MVVSGDVIVNNATVGPVLGELALSLDRLVTTPAGYKLAATSIDLDNSAVAGGNVYYNTLSNQGTIAGTQFTPLALPVFANLPTVSIRPAGSDNVTVANNGQVTLDEGAYGDLVVGNSATVHLTGGGYAFRSITIKNSGELRYAAPTDIVVSGRVDLAAKAVIQPETNSGLTPAAMRIQVDGINGSNGALTSTPPSVHVGQSGKVFAHCLRHRGLDRLRPVRGRKRCVPGARHSRRTLQPSHHQQRLRPRAGGESADRLYNRLGAADDHAHRIRSRRWSADVQHRLRSARGNPFLAGVSVAIQRDRHLHAVGRERRGFVYVPRHQSRGSDRRCDRDHQSDTGRHAARSDDRRGNRQFRADERRTFPRRCSSAAPRPPASRSPSRSFRAPARSMDRSARSRRAPRLRSAPRPSSTRRTPDTPARTRSSSRLAA